MSDILELKRAVCMWCHDHCRVIVHIRNGVLEKIEEDAAHPHANDYSRWVRACPRARAAAEWFYHPERLNYPLKRAGERGEGKWQKISWDQAFDEIAEKLKALRDKCGAESLATISGTARSHDEYRRRFMHLFGSPNYIGQGEICFGPALMVSSAIFGMPAFLMGRHAKCILLIGTNPEQAFRRIWLNILEELGKGSKLIVLDPRRTATTERADIWLRLRPGTDTAVLMGMINVIIQENYYDKEFVTKWCHGFEELKKRAEEYPLDKVEQISWVPAEKIRNAARMFATIKPATAWNHMGIEHLTNGIEALHCRFILPAITGNLDVRGGNMLYGLHPTFISNHEIEMVDHFPEVQKKKALGADRFKLMAWPGYDLIKMNAKKGWGYFIGSSHTLFAHAPTTYRAMITGKPYPLKAALTVGANPMVTQGNTKLVYKALKNLDLHVVMEYWLTPTAELADYVLPAASWLERPEIYTASDASSWIEVGEASLPHIVPGKYDRRRDYDLYRELGMRLGQKEYWPWETLEDAYSARLAPLGYNLHDFVHQHNGFDMPRPQERKYEKMGFSTSTGKVELYSVVMEKLGYDPLPRYYEPPESPISQPELAREFPYILITGGRHQPFYHSEHRQIESNRKRHPHPLMQLHPDTAKEHGIEEGDWVWVETPRGRMKQKCQYMSELDRSVVHVQHGWWFPEEPGEEPWLHGVWKSNCNILTDDDPDACNEMSGGWPLRAGLCRFYKVKTF